MIKKTLFFVFILVSFFSRGQQVSYKTYFNDPTALSNKKVYLDILTMDGLTLGAGLHGYYSPIKNLSVNGLFRYTYYDFFTKLAEKDSKNPIKNPFTGEAGAQFQFASYIKKKEKKVGVLLEGGINSKTYIKVPAKKARSFGVRGGVMMYRVPIKNSNAFPFVSEGGDMDSTKKLYSNGTSTCLYFGYTGRKVRKIGIDADGYGKRKSYMSRVFFADVITGGTVLADVDYNGKTWDIKKSKKDPLGFRLGWEWDENGTVTRFEFGKRPGFHGSIFPINYFMLSFGFSIYGGEKFVAKDN